MDYQKAYREAARVRRLQQRAEASAARAAKQAERAERASKIADRALRDLSKYERYAQHAQRALKRYERALSVAKKHGVKLEPGAYAPPEEESLLKGLPEDVAGPITDEAVHRIRKEIAEEQSNVTKLPPPSAEEIAEWEKRREERRREVS